MEWIEDMKAFREKAGQAEGRRLTEAMEKSVRFFTEHFRDDPRVESGWGHAYFCSDCGSFLRFLIAAK